MFLSLFVKHSKLELIEQAAIEPAATAKKGLNKSHVPTRYKNVTLSSKMSLFFHVFIMPGCNSSYVHKKINRLG